MAHKITDIVLGGTAIAKRAKLSDINLDINSVKIEGVDVNKIDTNDNDPDIVIIEGFVISKFEKRNLNALGYKNEDMERLYKDGKLFNAPYLGIIDWGHDFSPRGVWYEAEIRENKEAGGLGLYGKGVIFAWLFPDFANWVIGASERGELRFSTAVYSEYYECSVCGTTVKSKTDFENMCSHMKLSLANIGIEDDSLAIIYMRNPVILGASVTVYPADEKAEGEVEKVEKWSNNEIDSNSKEGNMDENKNLVALKGNLSYLKKLPIDTTSSWSFEAKDGNAIIDKFGFDVYKKVHLAQDKDANPKTKGAYSFPVAKIKNGRITLFRRGVIAAKQRAAQFGYQNIVSLADSLLKYIDSKNNNEEEVNMEEITKLVEAINALKEQIQQHTDYVKEAVEKFSAIIDEKEKEIDALNKNAQEEREFHNEEVEKVKEELRDVLVNSIVEKFKGRIKKEDLDAFGIDALKAMNEKIAPELVKFVELNTNARIGKSDKDQKNPFEIE